MRYSILLSIVYYLYFSKAIEDETAQKQEELICNQDKTDCYPKIFEPSWDWQIIKPGQDIPPGLHVRLNIDTLKREAKFMDPDEQDTNHLQELMVGDSAEVYDRSNDVNHEMKNENTNGNVIQNSRIHRAKASRDDLNNFDSAVLEVEDFQGNKERLAAALDTLTELSHDIEFGIELTKDKQIFDSLFRVAESIKDNTFVEKIYRIIGSTLRNNPLAIENVITNFGDAFSVGIFNQLHGHSDGIIQKRILGIIHALTQNNKFVAKYFSFENSRGLDAIIDIYPELDSESRIRASNILEDLSLFGKSNDRRSIEQSTPDFEVSKFIQESFVNGRTNPDNFKVYFNRLKELHQRNKDLKPSKKFLGWLSDQVESRKEHKKRDDYSDEDKEFDKEMLIARHAIFGNPMGLRKSFGDEL